MTDRAIIDWPAWTDSPPGRYVLEWEQTQLDRVVSDVFGYHALQLGLPQLDALRENRMPCRGLVLDAASGASAPYAFPRGLTHAGIRHGSSHGTAPAGPARPATKSSTNGIPRTGFVSRGFETRAAAVSALAGAS